MKSIFVYVSQLANSQRRLIENLAGDKNYSGAQGKVLHYLFINEGSTVYQKEIEAAFGLRPSTATEILNSLVDMGVIKRIPSREDGRFKEIVLTDEAEKYREDVFSDMKRLEETLTYGMTDEEVTAWLGITEKLLENLHSSEGKK